VPADVRPQAERIGQSIARCYPITRYVSLETRAIYNTNEASIDQAADVTGDGIVRVQQGV